MNASVPAGDVHARLPEWHRLLAEQPELLFTRRSLDAPGPRLCHLPVPVTSILVDELARLLADPLRARIVDLLAGEELCVCHLVAATGAAQSTVSHHVRLLKDAGLVSSEPVGRFTYYRLEPEPLDSLAARVGGLAQRARGASRQRPACS